MPLENPYIIVYTHSSQTVCS